MREINKYEGVGKEREGERSCPVEEILKVSRRKWHLILISKNRRDCNKQKLQGDYRVIQVKVSTEMNRISALNLHPTNTD